MSVESSEHTSDGIEASFSGGGNGVELRLVDTLDAPAADVWSALTIDDQVREWLTVTFTIDARVGGALRFEFGGGDLCSGVVTELAPNRVLAYDWTFPGMVTRLRWDLTEVGPSSTRLQLSHAGVPAEKAGPFAAAWHAHFEQLAAHLRGEAHDRERRRAEVFTPRFQALLPGYQEQVRSTLEGR